MQLLAMFPGADLVASSQEKVPQQRILSSSKHPGREPPPSPASSSPGEADKVRGTSTDDPLRSLPTPAILWSLAQDLLLFLLSCWHVLRMQRGIHCLSGDPDPNDFQSKHAARSFSNWWSCPGHVLVHCPAPSRWVLAAWVGVGVYGWVVSWVLLETLCTVVGTCTWGEVGRGLAGTAAGGCTQLVHCLMGFWLAVLPNGKK